MFRAFPESEFPSLGQFEVCSICRIEKVHWGPGAEFRQRRCSRGTTRLRSLSSPLLRPPLRCHGHRFSPRAPSRRVRFNLRLSRVRIGWSRHVTRSGMLIHGNHPQAPPPRATAGQPAGCAAESRGGGLRGGPGRARPGGGGARRPPQVTGGRVRAGAGWRRRGGARGTPGAARRA